MSATKKKELFKQEIWPLGIHNGFIHRFDNGRRKNDFNQLKTKEEKQRV